MPKVALVANADWGHYQHRLPLARALRDRGCEVVFICPLSGYEEKLRREGFRCLRWSLDRRSLNPFREALAVLRLVRIYRRESPDVVHHFTVKPILYGSLAAKLGKVPTVLNTFTGVSFPFLEEGLSLRFRPFLEPLLRWLLHSPKVFTIFHNPRDRDLLVSRKTVPLERTAVILGSGVDTNRFAPAANGRRREPPVVLMASRLLWDKGVSEFVQAARWLKGEGVQAKFWVAGPADPGSRVGIPEVVVQDWRREGAVEFLGQQDEMPDLLRNTDVAVLPSHHEGLPAFLLEATASGLPVVATDVGGCGLVVRDGVNGILVPVKDSRALGKALKRLLQDSELRQRMGRAGRELAEQEFNEERIAGQYLQVYKQVEAL